MNEKQEEIYTQGETQALKGIIIYCQNKLRELGVKLKTKEEFDSERIDAVRMLRGVCHYFGDNDWDDDLHLADVIDKHLMRYLEEN